MRVLYLFTSYRGEVYKKAKRGEDHGNGFWGMLRLAPYGVEAEYIELEQVYPWGLSKFIRKYVGVYWIHLLLFFKFFSYDFVFTSTAFGTQLVHTLLHIHRPRWVMHDFSIMGLVGEGKTLKQKMFIYLINHCAGIVTLGQEEKEQLEKRFPRLRGRVECIPFGVDLNYFIPNETPEEQKIFAPGRDPDRDYTTLFAASESLDVPILLTTFASRLKKFKSLPAFVEVKDFSLPEYVDAYRRVAVVVIPLDTSSGLNNAMGFSVLQEALAMGKAIVATRTGMTESYITDGENGLLVPEGDIHALRAALERLLADVELRERLGRNARLYAQTHLDAQKLGEKLADFFKRLA